jgi:hypothetical protein
MASLSWNQVVDSTYPSLSIPSFREGMSVLDCALEYARSGWFVLPIRMNTKHAGSFLGKGWPNKSSQDPKVISDWFQDKSLGLALHIGRSGGIVLDVDYPDVFPERFKNLLADPKIPFQSTQCDGDPYRGHYFFSLPKYFRFGNSVGNLGKGWGDVRGENGIVVVYPSLHSRPDGKYQWVRNGKLPPLPQEIADRLPRLRGKSPLTLTSLDMDVFINENTSNDYQDLLSARIRKMSENIPVSGGRHTHFQTYLCLILKDVKCGFYPARLALDAVEETFDFYKPKEEQSPNEFGGMSVWAASKADEMSLGERALHVYRVAPHLSPEVAKWVQRHAK